MEGWFLSGKGQCCSHRVWDEWSRIRSKCVRGKGSNQVNLLQEKLTEKCGNTISKRTQEFLRLYGHREIFWFVWIQYLPIHWGYYIHIFVGVKYQSTMSVLKLIKLPSLLVFNFILCIAIKSLSLIRNYVLAKIGCILDQNY